MANNTKQFLTDEQLEVVMGPLESDSTLDSEFAWFFEKHPDQEIVAISAKFTAVQDDGVRKVNLHHFTAWTQDYVLLTINGLFCDKYLIAIPKESKHCSVEQTEEGESDDQGT